MKNKIIAYDRQVPRYTSYPTAPNFKEIGAENNEYTSWLMSLPDDARISLYLHVPFCTKMCWYCGCHTKITQKYEPVSSYTDLLLKEIDMLGGYIKHGQEISHVHFGGGSPSLLIPEDFTKIMNALRGKFTFAGDIEIAMEIDPRGVTPAHIDAYVASGLNRASFGVQDFNDKVLDAVNRPQPMELTQNLLGLLRTKGVNHINFDFIYGLPHQTVATITDTMHKAIELNPSRISLFGYAHVPWMKKHMQMMDYDALPGNNLRYDLFETASKILNENGYISIGIDHFAKENDALVVAQNNKTLRRNFQGYTTDTADAMIGIGSSSIGKFPQGFVQNSPHMPIYTKGIMDGVLPVSKLCVITDDDKLRADVIEQLMTNLTADIPAICIKHKFAPNYLDDDVAGLNPFVNDGLVDVTDGCVVTINPNARQVIRLVASQFDAYLPKVGDADKPRHSRAI